jgi:hypothetical protein
MSEEEVKDAQWIVDRLKTKYDSKDKICAPPRDCTFVFQHAVSHFTEVLWLMVTIRFSNCVLSFLGGEAHATTIKKYYYKFCVFHHREQIFTFVCTWITEAFKKIFFRNVCTTVMFEPSHEPFPVPRTFLD